MIKIEKRFLRVLVDKLSCLCRKLNFKVLLPSSSFVLPNSNFLEFLEKLFERVRVELFGYFFEPSFELLELDNITTLLLCFKTRGGASADVQHGLFPIISCDVTDFPMSYDIVPHLFGVI